MGMIQPHVDFIHQLFNGSEGDIGAGLVDGGDNLAGLVKQLDVRSDCALRANEIILQSPSRQGVLQHIAAFPEIQSHTQGVFLQIIQYGAYVQTLSGQVDTGPFHPVISADLQIFQINCFINTGI